MESVITKKDLNKLYMELGKAYYEGGFEDPLPELLPLFDKITRMRKEILQLENVKKESVREKDSDMEAGTVYTDPEKVKNTMKESSQHLFCVNCGKPLDPNAVFCGNCGTRVE